MLRAILTTTLIAIVLTGCGPSAEEQAKMAAEKRTKDSIRTADSLSKLLQPRKDIFNAAVSMVKENLKAPSTAYFAPVKLQNDSVVITEIGKDTAWVVGHYDSQNAFGTYLHGCFKARIRRDSTGKWVPLFGSNYLDVNMEYNPKYDIDLPKP